MPCDFMGHIWLFSTVKGCVLWLIKMCPKYMVYFFRIWTEKNQFNSKSRLVCLSGENRGLWSPWVTIALRQLLTCVIIGLPHLDVKADCQSLSSVEPTLTCRRSSINLLNVLNLGLPVNINYPCSEASLACICVVGDIPRKGGRA